VSGLVDELGDMALARHQRDEDLVDQACRKCGCTDDHACPGGCFWIADDLCSACGPRPMRWKKRKAGLVLTASGSFRRRRRVQQ
jgi:hypothetical protein